jgi:hypothetical protein
LTSLTITERRLRTATAFDESVLSRLTPSEVEDYMVPVLSRLTHLELRLCRGGTKHIDSLIAEMIEVRSAAPSKVVRLEEVVMWLPHHHGLPHDPGLEDRLLRLKEDSQCNIQIKREKL